MTDKELFGISEQLDTISRQAALDAIKKLEKPAPTAQHLSAIFDCEDTIEALPSAQPEQRWIPCSERLPEGITQVIIQTNGEAIHEAIYMGKDDYGHYVWKRPDNEIYWDEEVVAWMPLPTPYQPKEDICK